MKSVFHEIKYLLRCGADAEEQLLVRIMKQDGGIALSTAIHVHAVFKKFPEISGPVVMIHAGNKAQTALLGKGGK